jgi:hypothetical protein
VFIWHVIKIKGMVEGGLGILKGTEKRGERVVRHAASATEIINRLFSFI